MGLKRLFPVNVARSNDREKEKGAVCRRNSPSTTSTIHERFPSRTPARWTRLFPLETYVPPQVVLFFPTGSFSTIPMDSATDPVGINDALDRTSSTRAMDLLPRPSVPVEGGLRRANHAGASDASTPPSLVPRYLPNPRNARMKRTSTSVFSERTSISSPNVRKIARFHEGVQDRLEIETSFLS